jgi:hypothetical protein
MIKFTLVIWVCSFLGGQVCMPPTQSPILYNSWYECSRAAHKESLHILSKIGYKRVNDNKIATRYTCRLVDSV